MGTTSVSAPPELVEQLDDVIWQLKREGHLDRSVDRSEVTRDLWRLFIYAHGVGDTPPQNEDIVAAILSLADEGGGADVSDDEPLTFEF